jgi:hypothetical protein
MSSCRETRAPVAANIDASSTKPTMKNTPNQAIAGPIAGSRSSWPLSEAPAPATSTMSAICATASTVVPRILPVNSARVEIAASRISITLVDFSSTTDCAIVMPKVMAEAKKTTPNAIATR